MVNCAYGHWKIYTPPDSRPPTHMNQSQEGKTCTEFFHLFTIYLYFILDIHRRITPPMRSFVSSDPLRRCEKIQRQSSTLTQLTQLINHTELDHNWHISTKKSSMKIIHALQFTSIVLRNSIAHLISYKLFNIFKFFRFKRRSEKIFTYSQDSDMP